MGSDVSSCRNIESLETILIHIEDEVHFKVAWNDEFSDKNSEIYQSKIGVLEDEISLIVRQSFFSFTVNRK